MSMSDAVFPFILAALVFLGFANGCDRTRLKFLEDDSREYRKRILELEIEMRAHDMRLKKVEVAK